ncbi:hypothetical protein M3642_03005 [Priestia megaterium]|nr:hypothetical protein [Priestia megaterium]
MEGKAKTPAGKAEGVGEIPQDRKRRGGSSAARGKRSLARKSTAVSSDLCELMYPICSVFRLDSFRYISTFFMYHKRKFDIIINI